MTAVEWPLNRRCSYCLAAPGQGCRTKYGRPAARTHAERFGPKRCTCLTCRTRHPRVTRTAPNVSLPDDANRPERVTPR